MTIVINGTTGISGVDGSAGTPAVQGTDTNTGVFYPAADTVGVSTGGSERVRVDSSGNVGIGTSSPAYKLDVSATSFIAASVSTSYSGAGNIRIADASTTSGSAPYIGSVGNNLTFGRIGTAEYMRIDSSGNVGIGTTSPTSILDVRTANDALANVQSTGTIQSAILNLVGRQSSVDNTWSIVSTGSGLTGAQLRFTRGGWTGTPSMLIDSSSNLQFNSGYGSVATAYGCRAWVNFNGTGTVAIRSSGNVTSITDNNVGNYTVNFTNAMPDANYAVTFGVGGGGSGLNASFVAGVLTSTQYGTASNKNTTAVQFTTGDYTATLRDLGEIYVSIFR